MNKSSILARLLLAAACAGLTGCFGFLKPTHVDTRYFVLTPLATKPEAAGAPASVKPLSLGVGFVSIPSSLYNNAIAVRHGTNELKYEETLLWAERLDTGLQRVLAANLGALLPTEHLRLAVWRPEDVNLEIYVNVEQFDVDDQGQGTLIAWWRILSPGGEATLKTGQFRARRPGPRLETDPQGAIATLSELAADLSREIVQGIKSSAR
jgi:uncharacterized lipoprotein YmbA